MAKNKNKKQTSIYLMALLAVALVIAGALIYLWVTSSTPASEASTGPFVDHTNTMHFNGREDTLVLGALSPTVVRNMKASSNYSADPILRTENEIRKIQLLVKQAEDLIATATGNVTSIPTPITDEPTPSTGGLTIEDPFDNGFPSDGIVTPFDDDFIVDDGRDDESPIEDTDEPIDGDKDIDELLVTQPEEKPNTWLQKTGDSIKSFFGRATDTVKRWFGIKKQTSPIVNKATLSSFKVETSSAGTQLIVEGTNLKINEEKNLAPEKNSKLTVFFEKDFSNIVFKDTEFLVADNEIIVYSSTPFEEIVQVYFESPTLGLINTTNNTTAKPTTPKQTAPITGGEPTPPKQTAPVTPEPTQAVAKLFNFKAENLAIGGSKIVISGKNLKINNLKNLAPEKGSKLTIFFDDVSNKVFKDTEFLVANNSITAYSNERLRKVAQVYFESPTLGLKNTRNGTTITQTPINKPKITGYKVDNYGVYDMLIINGNNLLVSSNRSDKDEQVVIIYKDRTSNTYSSNQFFGGKDEVNIIGDIDEFRNIDTIYFESKARGVSQTTNQLSLINIANFFIKKAFAATSDGISTNARVSARRSALEELSQQVEDASNLISTHNIEIIQWIVSNKLPNQNISSITPERRGFGSDIYKTYSEKTGDDSIIGFLNWRVENEQVYNRKDKSETWSDVYQKYIVTHLDSSDRNDYSPNKIKSGLRQATKILNSLKNNDLVLKILKEADEYQNNNTFPIDFGVRYATGSVIFAELYGSDTEIKSAINRITNDRTMLNALKDIGRANSSYQTPKWIREALKTASNTDSFNGGVTPMLQTIN